jgi:hypothetical protein
MERAVLATLFDHSVVVITKFAGLDLGVHRAPSEWCGRGSCEQGVRADSGCQQLRLSLRFNHDRLPSCRTSGWFCDVADGVTTQAAFLKAGKRAARPDRAPFGRPGERPQGFGAFAGVSSVTKSCGNA